jgi:hypothetical protein
VYWGGNLAVVGNSSSTVVGFFLLLFITASDDSKLLGTTWLLAPITISGCLDAVVSIVFTVPKDLEAEAEEIMLVETHSGWRMKKHNCDNRNPRNTTITDDNAVVLPLNEKKFYYRPREVRLGCFLTRGLKP